MSDTIREKIIASIVTSLGAIRTAAGYATEAGQLVKRAQEIVDKDTLPALEVLPFTESNEQRPGRNNLTMQLRVNGVAKFTSENPSVMAEKLLGDIIKRMTSPALTKPAGNYTDKIEYSEGGTDDYPKPGQMTVEVHATFQIFYKTKIGDPYNQ